MDTITQVLDILNLIFLAIIPLIVKLLIDIKNFYMELKSYIIEHKVKIEEIEKDIKELRELYKSLTFEIRKLNNDNN